MFKDRVILDLHAGSGGDGVISWRREKYIPKGGPAGGDGGDGASLYLETSDHLYSLESYRHRSLIEAENGQNGASACKKGRSGESIVLKVPQGTLVKDGFSGEVLFDLVERNQRVLIAEGGRGGLGNVHFKSSTNRAPYFCTKGTPGETRRVELELKLIADVGLVGLPNAGKSTLFNEITHLEAKVGAYPFTTLQPQIGVVQKDPERRFFIADIPGIIKGASENKGLGLDFLRHIERTTFLVYVLDASQPTLLEDFLTLREEIRAYSLFVYNKPYALFLNKSDLEESQENVDLFIQSNAFEKDLLFIGSAREKEGVEKLKQFLESRVHSSFSLTSS